MLLQGGIKAGLIGGGIGIILVLLGYIPCLGFFISCLGSLALALGVGVLAVQMGGREIATAMGGLGAGAIAGGLTGFISSVASIFIQFILALLGIRVGLSTLFLGEVGFADTGSNIGGVLASGIFVCFLSVTIGVLLGGMAGLIFKALQGSETRPATA